jgi:hypothetical protein
MGLVMATWVVDGQEVTDRAGAAERLGLARSTVAVYSSPSGRRRVGWPEPLGERVDGREVFAVVDLDRFASSRTTAPRAVRDDGGPEELVDARAFAALLGVRPDTFKRYVEDSLNAWARDADGYLLRPDLAERAPHGSRYLWRRGRVAAWIKAAGRRRGGRAPGRRATMDELRAVLASGEGRPTVRELASRISARVGAEVSSQTVRRLLRRILLDSM